MDNGASCYRRFLDGEKEGLSEIVRTYADGLIFFINGYVGDINTAEDLAEDVFAKLIAKKPRFSGRSSFKTWLYTIARNIALDYIRHRPDHHEPISEAYSVSDATNIEERYITEEEKRTFHNVLLRLSPDYRQVLYLVYFEDFDNAEAALLMNKSKRQIENLLYRAKQALKKELEKEGMSYEKL